jgi:DNA-binding response OmpR family regulator
MAMPTPLAALPASALVPAQVAAFCNSPGSVLDTSLAQLVARGARVSTFAQRQLPLDWFDRYASSFDIALIDADYLGDKVEMIDFGMRMRRFAPELPIVMLSSRIASSDRSTERMAFCDVTLRLPVQEIELMEAFSIALENHAYWRDSRYEARLLQPRKSRAPHIPGGADDARDDPPTD